MAEKWWQNAVFYQIYPRSFCDADGDGYGDIPGIISKLDYLRELGINALWLSPVYVSPGADNGYDIADYMNIDPMFGTMADFDALIAEAKARGIRIIMDLVVNHTSNQHEWFQKSRRREPGYEDYYFWADKPNNWGGFFGGGTWSFDEIRGQYYLHLFDPGQPDLNWHCEAVRREVREILRFWLDRGVSGFRCDVINIIWKNSLANGKPRIALRGMEHYLSTEGCHRMLRELREEVFSGYDCFTVGETVFVSDKMGRDLCLPERGELDEIFYFEHMESDCIGLKWFKTPFKPERLFKALTKWQLALPWNANYFENHDQPRSVSRFGDAERYRERSAKLLCTLLFSLRGTPFVFEGQEIGMTNFSFTDISQVQDVESRNVYGILRRIGLGKALCWRIIAATSRDNARTPMQWDDGENAGFSRAEPWLGVNENYKAVNAAAQAGDPDSVLSYYKKMIALRANNAVLLDGDFEAAETGRKHFIFRRRLGDDSLTVLLNFSDADIKTSHRGEALINNCGGGSFRGTLRPWQGVIIREIDNA